MNLLIQIAAVALGVSLILWAVQAYAPTSPPIRQIVTLLVVLVVVAWLLSIAGVVGAPVVVRH